MKSTWRSGYRNPGSNSWESRSSTRRRFDRCAGIWVSRDPWKNLAITDTSSDDQGPLVNSDDAVSTEGSARAVVAQRIAVEAQARR